MEPRTHLLLLGPSSPPDRDIARALDRRWPGNRLYRAPDATAAVGALAGERGRPWPVIPDLVIVKVARPELARAEDFAALRRYPPLRDAPFAAFLEGARAGEFRCMRGAGLSVVLTQDTLAEQAGDLLDAVAGDWIAPRHVDCGERYFCPTCIRCVVASRAPARRPIACDTDPA